MPKCQIGCNLVGGNNALNCDKKVAGSHLLQGQPNQYNSYSNVYYRVLNIILALISKRFREIEHYQTLEFTNEEIP